MDNQERYDGGVSIRGRTRSTIKWAGAVVTVLLVIVWVGSGWCEAGCFARPTISGHVAKGRLVIGWEEPWRSQTCKDRQLPQCGYSRTGLPADRACPECGNP